MPPLHHVHLGMPLGEADAEETFLLEVPGFRRVAVPAALVGRPSLRG